MAGLLIPNFFHAHAAVLLNVFVVGRIQSEGCGTLLVMLTSSLCACHSPLHKEKFCK